MAENVKEMIVCSSCSKNFGLYRERIGGCTIIGESSSAVDVAQSVLLYVIRVIYSMPPAHGAALVETILSSDELRSQWHAELKVMRDRINGNRQLLVDKLIENGVTRDFSFITRQMGMFSFLGITPEQVQQLQDEYSIYMVGVDCPSHYTVDEGSISFHTCGTTIFASRASTLEIAFQLDSLHRFAPRLLWRGCAELVLPTGSTNR